MNTTTEKTVQQTTNLFVGGLSPIHFDDPSLEPSVMLHHLNSWSNLLYVDSVILPSQVRGILSTTFRNANSDITVMDLWRKANPHIVYVDSVFERDEVKLFGNSSSAIIFYERDPGKRFVPELIKELSPQSRNETLFDKLSRVIIEGVLVNQ
jgi:hypothetical protein